MQNYNYARTKELQESMNNGSFVLRSSNDSAIQEWIKLIRLGADPNTTYLYTNTNPLLIAATISYKDSKSALVVFKTLIDLGCNPSEFAHHLVKNRSEIINRPEDLLALGLDINEKDSCGKLPIDYLYEVELIMKWIDAGVDIRLSSGFHEILDPEDIVEIEAHALHIQMSSELISLQESDSKKSRLKI